MIAANKCEASKLYKTSRSEAGPTIFYEFLTEQQVKRQMRRLERRVASGKITTDELIVLNGARAALRREGRVAVRYIRGTTNGEKFEASKYCYIPGDYQLREIKRPPGFTRKRPAENENEVNDV